jgi:hypothetical protein
MGIRMGSSEDIGGGDSDIVLRDFEGAQFEISSPLRIPQLGHRNRMGVIGPNLPRFTFW